MQCTTSPKKPENSQLIEVRCGTCKKLKAKAKPVPGTVVEVFCRKCKAYTTVQL